MTTTSTTATPATIATQADLIKHLNEEIKFKDDQTNVWVDAYAESVQARNKEKSKYEDQIYWLEKDKFRSRCLLDEMDDEAIQLNETKLNLQREISFKDDTIMRLRIIIFEMLVKQKKDADSIDEIFDKDFGKYEDKVIEALELDTE
jgi:hypothetical protein